MKRTIAIPSIVALGLVFMVLMVVTVPAARSRPMGDYSNVDGLMVEGTFGTATPQILVKPTGGNVALEVQNANGTPVYQVSSAGDVAGNVLKYATPSTQIVCSTQTITDTANVSHGLTTASYALCSLNQTITGDSAACNATVTGGVTVTVKVRNSAATPAANSAGASINWCVIGTP